MENRHWSLNTLNISLSSCSDKSSSDCALNSPPSGFYAWSRIIPMWQLSSQNSSSLSFKRQRGDIYLRGLSSQPGGHDTCLLPSGKYSIGDSVQCFGLLHLKPTCLWSAFAGKDLDPSWMKQKGHSVSPCDECRGLLASATQVGCQECAMVLIIVTLGLNCGL